VQACVQDWPSRTATRQELHTFLRSLPASQFPALAAHGADAWANDRDQRFTAGFDTLLRGLQQEARPLTLRRTPEPLIHHQQSRSVDRSRRIRNVQFGLILNGALRSRRGK
jgi:hypothetical protein